MVHLKRIIYTTDKMALTVNMGLLVKRTII